MRVVLAPADAGSDAILELLGAWSAAGLLKPFCWWPLAEEGAGGDRLDVLTIIAGECVDTQLAEALRDVAPDQVELVALRAPATGTRDDTEFVEAVLERLAAAKGVIAPSTAHPLEPTMIVIPAKIGQSVDPMLFRAQWAANIYVAPEDRHDPGAPNALPGNADDFAPHAAHALATLADLWQTSGASDPILPSLARGDFGSQTVPVQVTRCFTRAVDFGYFPGQLAARVFRPGEGWPNPDADRFDRTSDARMIIEHLAPLFLSKHKPIIGLSEFVPMSLPEPRKLGILEAIRELLKTWATWVFNRPFELADAARVKVHDELARRLNNAAGPDPDWLVPLWGDRSPSVEEIFAEINDVPRRLRRPDGPTENAWTDLLKMSLGLMDGANLPAGLKVEALIHDAKRYVLTVPGAIVPDPAHPPRPTEEDPDPRVCDPLRAVLAVALPPTEGQPAPSVRITRGGGTAERTLVWKIGAQIAADLQQAEIEGAEIDEAAQEEQRRAAEQEHAKHERIERKRSRRHILRTLLINSAIATAATVAAWIKLPLLIAIAVTLLAGASWWAALGKLAIGLMHRRERSQLEPVRRAIAALNETLKRAIRAGDADRLRRRYKEYLDWAEIIGWLAHRPWVGEPLQRVELPAAIDPARLPAAFSVGIAAGNERLEELALRLRAGAGAGGRRIFEHGWLTDLYESLEHALTDRPDGRPSNPTPAADKDEDPTSPRRRLLRGIRAGVGRHLSGNPLAKELMKHVEGLQIDELAIGITPMGEDAAASSDALPPSTVWLNPPANLPDLARRLRPLVVRIAVERLDGDFGGSGVIVSADGLIATARHVIEQAERISVQFADGREVDAREYRVASHTDLALIAVVDRLTPEFASLAAADAIEQGDPVISLGHLRLVDGEPTLAWGLITAKQRRIEIDHPPAGIGRFDVIQATYESAGGASGSPVFDLDGRVVGIHSAGFRADGSASTADVPEHISSAVPVGDLHILLSATDNPGVGAVERPGASGSVGWVIPTEAALPVPSAFMSVEGDNPFIHSHWSDLTSEPNTAIRPLVSGGASMRVRDLAGECSFFSPIRVTRSVVQLAGSTPAKALASCGGIEGPSTPEVGDPTPSELDELG